jgi:hypothetical protein
MAQQRAGQASRRLGAYWLLALAVASAALVGCGGGGGSSETAETGSGAEEQEQGQAKALEKVPASDQAAFIEIATVIGTLRVRAAPVAVGKSHRLTSAAPLRAGRSRLAALRPRDPRLARLRDRLIPALTKFIHAPTSRAAARRAAKSAIADADRIEAGLRRYARIQPAVGALIPD